jgi:hypothetical protein
MEKKNHFNVNFKNSEASIKANITLISFKEGDNQIIYAPQLEVSGYGKNETEAMESFNISLAQFFDYTVNKKTIHTVLTSLGWKVSKGSVKHPKKINAPTWGDLIKNNESLESLLTNQNIVTSKKQIAIPV